MNELELASVKDVMSIIDSCINDVQLDVCEKLKVVYSQRARSKGVVNPEDIEEVLEIKIQEKREEIKYAEEFMQ